MRRERARDEDGGGEKGAAESTTSSIAQVIQTVLAAQVLTKGGLGAGKDK